MLRTYWSLTNLIRHTKISYLIASLVFRRFLCGTYWNGLHPLPQGWVLQKVRTMFVWYFCWNPHYSILMHRVRYLKNEFASWRLQVIIFPSEFKIRKYGRKSTNSRFFSACQIRFSENKNLTSNSWRWTNLYLTLNSWRSTDLQNLFRNSLLVPRMLHLRYLPYTPGFAPTERVFSAWS